MSLLKPLLLLAYLLSCQDYYRARLAELDSIAAVLMFLAMFGVLTLCLFLAAYTRASLLRWGYALALFGAAVFFDAYLRVTADYLTYPQFVSLLHSHAFIEDALRQFQSTVLQASVPGLLLLLGVGLKPGSAPVPGWVAGSAPWIGLLLLMAVLFVRAGAGARGLPMMYTPLAYLGLYTYEALGDTVGERQPVTLPREERRIDHDIVLIIDESVSGHYLDINHPDGVHSGLRNPPPGVSLYNYGYAASIANCSADTNVTLRYGGTRDDYLRINSTMPSIWQYARRAGLRTVYVDAQRTHGALQNLMSKDEVLELDAFIQYDDVPVRDRDMAVVDSLVELLGNDQPELILVNKMGAHFPVHDKFPDEFLRYQPALPRGRYLHVGDTGDRDGFDGTAEDWLRYRNSYRNTLLWNVGEFFSRLLARADLSRAVILYTSDHGQDLHERGNPGLNTHCGGDPVVEEGLVPLVVLQGSGLPTLDWQAELEANRNRSSHYNLFPTLLQLMGYRLDAILGTYGIPLSQRSEDEFTFNTRFNARLGAEPTWKRIDLEEVVAPNL
ncbi:MAG TPA: sulfatase-like hydrolase/transferase [Pseudomonas sp.]|nr:sulfatase-like hydrolase/transferase [Pseudomonas sp.]